MEHFLICVRHSDISAWAMLIFTVWSTADLWTSWPFHGSNYQILTPHFGRIFNCLPFVVPSGFIANFGQLRRPSVLHAFFTYRSLVLGNFCHAHLLEFVLLEDYGLIRKVSCKHCAPLCHAAMLCPSALCNCTGNCGCFFPVCLQSCLTVPISECWSGIDQSHPVGIWMRLHIVIVRWINSAIVSICPFIRIRYFSLFWIHVRMTFFRRLFDFYLIIAFSFTICDCCIDHPSSQNSSHQVTLICWKTICCRMFILTTFKLLLMFCALTKALTHDLPAPLLVMRYLETTKQIRLLKVGARLESENSYTMRRPKSLNMYPGADPILGSKKWTPKWGPFSVSYCN